MRRLGEGTGTITGTSILDLNAYKIDILDFFLAIKKIQEKSFHALLTFAWAKVTGASAIESLARD
jgi:hypothetical protein